MRQDRHYVVGAIAVELENKTASTCQRTSSDLISSIWRCLDPFYSPRNRVVKFSVWSALESTSIIINPPRTTDAPSCSGASRMLVLLLGSQALPQATLQAHGPLKHVNAIRVCGNVKVQGKQTPVRGSIERRGQFSD